MLAAQSYGLGTCWIGFSKFLNDSREWCERLGVEEPYEISEAITVGYPVGDPTPPDRTGNPRDRLVRRRQERNSLLSGGRAMASAVHAASAATFRTGTTRNSAGSSDATIDLEKCDGCKLCTIALPRQRARAVRRQSGRRRSRVKEDGRGCISCNNCHAICDAGAIDATMHYDFVGYYRQFGRAAFCKPRMF